MKNALITLTLILTGLACSGLVFADVKIKSKQTTSGQSYDSTTYIKGKRQRSESMNGMMIGLTQCDMRRSVQLNSQTKTYMVNPFDDAQPVGKSTAVVDKNGVVQAGGQLTTTITTKDTGERKQMFGFTARRLISTIETVSSADACNKTNTKMQTDGWYIDAEFALDCDYGYQNYNPYSSRTGGCRDKYQVKTVGTAKRGYPVYEKMTMFDDSGNESFSMVNEVVELSRSVLDASLFDIPADYREVQNASQMYAAAAVSNDTFNKTTGSTDATAKSIRSAAQRTPTNSVSTVSAKQPGVVRIGLAGVKTGAVGDGISAADLAAAVRNTLASYLKAPRIEVVTLDSKLADAVAAEAAQKECDYIVHSNVSHKKGGGGGFGGMFGQAVGSAIGRTGIGHTGSTAGNIAGQVATNTAVTATTVAANVKSKDEITLDITVNKADGTAAHANLYKAKAKSSGDDIISQIVEQAAAAIVNALGK